MSVLRRLRRNRKKDEDRQYAAPLGRIDNLVDGVFNEAGLVRDQVQGHAFGQGGNDGGRLYPHHDYAEDRRPSLPDSPRRPFLPKSRLFLLLFLRELPLRHPPVSTSPRRSLIARATVTVFASASLNRAISTLSRPLILVRVFRSLKCPPDHGHVAVDERGTSLRLEMMISPISPNGSGIR